MKAFNDIEYEDINCPICNSVNLEKKFEATLGKNEVPLIGYDYSDNKQNKTFAYSYCLDCTHLFATPRIKNLHKYYIDKIDDHYLVNSQYRQFSYQNVLNIIEKFKTNGNLLDFGSGMGDFLEQAIKKKYKCAGIELSKFSSEISIKKGHKIFSTNLHLLDKEIKEYFKSEKIDIVIMMGVIEHLENPSKDLNKIKSLLSNDGLVVLWTGDSGCMYSKLLGRKWWYVIGQHIQLFSRKSLIKLFKNHNFEIIYNKNFPYVFDYKYFDFHLKRYWIYKYFLRFFIYPFLLIKNRFTLYLSSEILMIYRKK